MHATRHFHNRIAVVFDFDDTLAPDTFRRLVESSGLDSGKFRAERVQPLVDVGWDSSLARLFALIKVAGEDERVGLTRRHLTEVGRQTEFCPGVPEMFDRVRMAAQAIVEDVEVEFYVLTSGFAELARASRLAGEFKAIWGGEFLFADGGEAVFAKQIVTHPEKTRYIMQLAKGLDMKGPNSPADVYRDVPDEAWHVPLDQILYVGDGASDMPVFGLLHDRGGMAIGVFKGDNVKGAAGWAGYEDMFPGRRITNLAAARYGDELLRSILLAVESIAKRLALLRLGEGQ